MLYDTFSELDRELTRLTSGWHAPTDVRRESDRYVVEMDLPGIDPGSIDVTLEGGTLTVRAERSDARESEDRGWLVRERTHAAVLRRFELGDTVDPDAIEASYADGVLRLALPFAEHAKPRKIAVSGASARELASGAGTSHEVIEGKAEAAHSVTS